MPKFRYDYVRSGAKFAYRVDGPSIDDDNGIVCGVYRLYPSIRVGYTPDAGNEAEQYRFRYLRIVVTADARTVVYAYDRHDISYTVQILSYRSVVSVRKVVGFFGAELLSNEVVGFIESDTDDDNFDS